jgi:hypothetical protein
MEENQEQQELEQTTEGAQTEGNSQPEGEAGTPEKQESADSAEYADSREQQKQQSRQENARQAEGRRIREREQRAYDAAYRQARNDMSDLLRSIGIKNPQTGGIVNSVEEMEDFAKKLREKRGKEGRLNEDDIRRIVRETERESRRQQTQQSEPQGKNPVVEMELAEIRAMDPEMKDLGAILNSEAGDRFRQYVDRGFTFLEAYKLAAEDRLRKISGNRERARQGGKEHLASTVTRGKGGISVPPEVMAQFRALLPDATDEDIRKFYAADQKRLGK